jgi:hypothetical protein
MILTKMTHLECLISHQFKLFKKKTNYKTFKMKKVKIYISFKEMVMIQWLNFMKKLMNLISKTSLLEINWEGNLVFAPDVMEPITQCITKSKLIIYFTSLEDIKLC